MIEGAGFHEHVDRLEGMLKQIQGSDDRVSALFPTVADEDSTAELSAKVTNLADELEQEVAYFQGIFDKKDFGSVDADRLSKMSILLTTARQSLKAQEGRFGKELGAGYKNLEKSILEATWLIRNIATFAEIMAPEKGPSPDARAEEKMPVQSYEDKRRMVQRRRRRGQQRNKRINHEDVSPVVDYIKKNREAVFAGAKEGALYHRQHADSEFRHSFQVLNIETAASPDEMVVVIHPKPFEKKVTRKGKETNVMHVGIGGEKTVKKSVMVDLTTETSKYVAVATSRQDVYRGKELVEKELGILTQLAGKPNIIQIKGHCVYQVKKKKGVKEPLPEKVNMVLEYGENDLRGELAKGKFSEEKRQKYALGLLTGLVEVHKEGYIHYDLKIDNIFVVDGVPHIGDFGSAAKVGIPVTRRGTTHIIPPEMHRLIDASTYKDNLRREQAKVGSAMDVFEMGVILYQMKHNGSPQFSRDIREATKKVADDESIVDDFEDYAFIIENWYEEAVPTDDEDKIIFSMLNPDPDKRPSAKEALNQFDKLFRET